MKRELIVFVVAVLFLGFAIAPSINANLYSPFFNDDFVELEVELCGLGLKHIVTLEKNEAKEVFSLFDKIKADLDKAVNREEAEAILEDAIIELDDYGLLGGLSVEKTKSLVTKNYLKSDDINIIQTDILDENSNFFCLVAGNTTNTVFFGRLSRMIGRIMSSVFLILEIINELELTVPDSIVNKLWEILEFYLVLSWFPNFFSLINILPFRLWCNVAIGVENIYWGYPYTKLKLGEYWPAEGWINSWGINGNKSWDGKFWGVLPIFPANILLFTLCYYGIMSFSGITIYYNADEPVNLFLGSALWVKIDSELPEQLEN